MFRGVNYLSLDDKGRLSVPSKYRDEIDALCNGQLITTVDRDKCLLIYPLPEWQRIEQALMSRPNIDPEVRMMQRVLVGHATECELSPQGRISIPDALRRFAGLDKHVALVGQGKKFELWDEERWNAQTEAWLQVGAGAGSTSEALDSLAL